MSSKPAQYEQFVSALDAVFSDPEYFRPHMVEEGIKRIEANLNNRSIHVLRPYVMIKASSPEMLCISTNKELLDLAEAVKAEIDFRRDQGVA